MYLSKYVFISLTSLIVDYVFTKEKKICLIRHFSFNIIIPSIVAT